MHLQKEKELRRRPTMAFSLPNLLFVFFVSLFIFWKLSSYTQNVKAFSLEINGCDQLKSTVSSLQSIIKEKDQELLSKEEKIRELMLLTQEKCEAQEHNSKLENKWIPKSFKDMCVTLSIYVEPKTQYVTNKSIEVFYTSKQTLTPILTKGFNVSFDYLQAFRVVIIPKLKLEKVQVALEPYTKNVRHGFKKLLDLTEILWRMQ